MSVTPSYNLDMFRPPVDRAMRVLDRSFFRKTVPLAAVRIFENSQISGLRKSLARDMLDVERISSVKPDPTQSDPKSDRKAILLRPDVKVNGMEYSLRLHSALMQRR